MTATGVKRTRILLFSPELRERTYPGRPPIYYLSAALRRAGYRVKTLDVDIVGRKRFMSALKTFQPHIVAGTSLSIQINDALSLFRVAKTHSRKILTVLGGNHATAAFKYLYPLHADYLDVVIAGEGLTAIVKIADLIERREWHSKRGDVPGAVFHDGASLSKGVPGAAELPDSYSPDLPYHPSYDFDIFARPDGTRRRTFQLMTAFGCQNACFFCFSSVNKRGEPTRGERRMSIACVERILRQASGLGYEAVYFDDDTFTRIPSYAIEVARLCKKYDLVFGCHTRPDCEDEEVIAELVSNGCRYMFSGLESAVPEILLGANKTDEPEAYREAYRRSYHFKNRLGLPVCAFLIHGMARRDKRCVADPGESVEVHGSLTRSADTLDDSVTSLEFAIRELDPTYLSMNILRFIPGVMFSESPMFEFLRPVDGPLHGGYFDEKWLAENGKFDPRSSHPILRAFEGAGSPIPRHMTPQRCYDILCHAVRITNAKNREPGRNQTQIVVDPWFRMRFMEERRVGDALTYELAPFHVIDDSQSAGELPMSAAV